MHEKNDQQLESRLIAELLREKRSDRLWKTIRSLAWLALWTYFVVGLFSLFSDNSSSDVGNKSGKYAALVRLDGMIAPGREFSGQEIIPILEKAFADKHALGVVIDINSPGGTPVQAAIIHDAILMLKKKYQRKVVVVGEDMLTSGAYYVAVAADTIYVNPNTLTGSIGVIMKGFGFVDFLKKVGVERRVYISGDNKDRLDPFLPQTPEDIAKVKEVMDEVHNNFMQAVMEGRKGKFHGDPKTLFTGDFWSGQTAVKLGLADATGNLLDVLDKEFKTTRVKDYSGSNNIFRYLGSQLGSALDSIFFTY